MPAACPGRRHTSLTKKRLESPAIRVPPVRAQNGMEPANPPRMARPRRIIPGASYLLTRRTSQRTFRLRPHLVTNQIIRYCLAWAADRFGVLVHAVVAMSNHVHIVATDPRGVLPDFLREFHRNTAKALNTAQGQWENLWSYERASAVLLPTQDDVIAKIAYATANPVEAGLVETPEQWPGVLHWQTGTSMTIERPSAYFDPQGCSPASVELRIVPAPNLPCAASEWQTRLREAIATAVRRAQEKVRSCGMKFLGAASVVGESFLQRARNYERKFRTNPVLAARDVFVRTACIRAHRAFQRAYRNALEQWRAGDRSAIFPQGTWWMAVHHAVSVLPG